MPIINIKYCNKCPNIDHNGLLQEHPKRVCRKTNRKDNILGSIDKKISFLQNGVH